MGPHEIYFTECSELAELGQGSKDSGKQIFANIVFPPPNTAQWDEQVFAYPFSPYLSVTCIFFPITQRARKLDGAPEHEGMQFRCIISGPIREEEIKFFQSDRK